MMPQCRAPDLQMELLEVTRRDEPLTRKATLHLAACAPCQTAVERLRRMASVWIADQLDEQALSTAVARWQAARQTPHAKPRWQTPLAFAVMGAVAGLGVLVVSPASVKPGASLRERASVAAPPSSSSPSAIMTSENRGSAAPAAEHGDATSPHIEAPRGTLIALEEGLRFHLEEGESARVVLADGRTSELRGPCSVQFWASPSEVGGWRLSIERPATSSRETVDLSADSAKGAARPHATAEPPAPRDRSSNHSSTTSPQALQIARPDAQVATEHGLEAAPIPLTGNGDVVYERAWARAAEALRKDDFDGADRAFGELCRAPDAATRDAARLARAQLWIAHGRGAAVRPVLQNLAVTGATALVRERAAEFLSRESP